MGDEGNKDREEEMRKVRGGEEEEGEMRRKKEKRIERRENEERGSKRRGNKERGHFENVRGYLLVGSGTQASVSILGLTSFMFGQFPIRYCIV